MTDTPSPSRFWPIWLITVFGVALLLVGGGVLYMLAEKTIADFYQKLADLCLQLAVVVIIGGALKAITDRRKDERKEEQAASAERSAQRREFAQRAREMHVPIELARDLLRAHRSPKTYSEQHQELMKLRFQIEDLHADLKITEGLFDNKETILEGIEGILRFLRLGKEEYERVHNFLGPDWKSSPDFAKILEKRNMKWTQSLMSGEGEYNKYLGHLENSKGEMRSQVFGA